MEYQLRGLTRFQNDSTLWHGNTLHFDKDTGAKNQQMERDEGRAAREHWTVHLMSASLSQVIIGLHCAKKPVTTILTYPWKYTVLHCNHLGNTWRHWCWWPNTLIITLASARAIIKVSGHQHQWFPGVSQVVTM